MPLQLHYDLITPIAWAVAPRTRQAYRWPCIVWTMWCVRTSPARRCEILLTRTGRVVGTIRDAHTRLPIANAAVHLLNPGNVVIAATTTAADGTYELTDITLGDYTLRVIGYPPMSARAVLNGAGNSSLDLHLGHP